MIAAAINADPRFSGRGQTREESCIRRPRVAMCRLARYDSSQLSRGIDYLSLFRDGDRNSDILNFADGSLE